LKTYKILLIAHGKDTYPAGLADIYLFLKNKGYDVDFLNTSVCDINKYLGTPDYVGITSMTTEFNNTALLSKYVKNRWPFCKLILGGRHFNSDTVNLKTEQNIPEADHIVVGEGEYAMLDIINNKNCDRIIFGKSLSLEDYKSISFPDFNFISKNMPTALNAQRSRVLFARGCPFKCVFCESETGRKPVISKDPDVCARYIKDIAAGSGFNDVFIYDDIFAINKKWLKDFCVEYKNQSIKVNIRCFIHGRLFDEETLDLLKQINTVSVCLGAESGDNSVLEAINKKTTVEDYIKIHNMISKNGKGVKLECLWMLGNITDTNESMKKTVELSKVIGHTHPSWFSYAIPFPGTTFWKKAEEYGKIIEPDFRKWKNQTLVFVPNGVTEADMRGWYLKARS
jgi:radical SAM superfamily enzyme YgiQ (UPF0313 family)